MERVFVFFNENCEELAFEQPIEVIKHAKKKFPDSMIAGTNDENLVDKSVDEVSEKVLADSLDKDNYLHLYHEYPDASNTYIYIYGLPLIK